MGALAIVWTARGAVTCWAARFLFPGTVGAGVPRPHTVALSLSGWLLLVAHTLCAFHFEHHWSHAAAYAHTAQRTRETVGWSWGGGLYVNYATIAVWAADVMVQARALRRGRIPPRWWRRTAETLIGFVMLNATVVFGPGGWRWAAAAVVGIALVQQRRRRAAGCRSCRSSQQRPPPS